MLSNHSRTGLAKGTELNSGQNILLAKFMFSSTVLVHVYVPQIAKEVY